MHTCFRHELGHQALTHAKQRAAFFKAYDKSGIKRSVIREQISTYAGESDIHEYFAECFVIYTSPEFKVGMLNKALGYDVESIIKKCLDTDPSVF